MDTNQKTVAFHTLGCKLNFSETSAVGKLFSDQGFIKKEFTEHADIYVINTCSVTSQAEKKCRQAIHKALSANPQGFIIVMGCYAQLRPGEIAAIPKVDLIISNKDKFRILEFINNLEKRLEPEIYSCQLKDLKNFEAAFSVNDRTRSFLKVQDGCDYFCTYCTVPYARGQNRNDTIENTVSRAQDIVNQGFKEIVLTGVNIGEFGKSTNEDFFGLVKELDKIKEQVRFRISSIEPNLLTNEIIDFVKSSNHFMPHFHIPLQSGNDEILKVMHRKYDTNLFNNRIKYIKTNLPEAFIGIDLIVGFPGETDEHFWQTYEFLKSMDISFIHVFSYSDRPGTKSFSMANKVRNSDITKRSQLLHELSEIKKGEFYKQNIGKTQTALIETYTKNGCNIGFTDNYLRVEVRNNESLVNQIIKVKLAEIIPNGNFEAFEINEI